jgi:hypothetical protein
MSTTGLLLSPAIYTGLGFHCRVREVAAVAGRVAPRLGLADRFERDMRKRQWPMFRFMSAPGRGLSPAGAIAQSASRQSLSRSSASSIPRSIIASFSSPARCSIARPRRSHSSTFTFAAESGRRLRWGAYLAFVVSGIAGWLANTATLLVAAEVLLLPVWLAKLVAILASFIVNFSLSHFVVFRARPRPAGEAGNDR